MKPQLLQKADPYKHWPDRYTAMPSGRTRRLRGFLGLFCVMLGLSNLMQFKASGDPWELVGGLVCAAAAIVFFLMYKGR